MNADAIKTSPADEMLADDWLKFFKSKMSILATKFREQQENIDLSPDKGQYRISPPLCPTLYQKI